MDDLGAEGDDHATGEDELGAEGNDHAIGEDELGAEGNEPATGEVERGAEGSVEPPESPAWRPWHEDDGRPRSAAQR